MLIDLHTFTSKDPSYVALQGYQNRVTVKVRVDSVAIDDLPGLGIRPTEAQRLSFVRHNIESIRQIAEKKLEGGDGHPEDCNGQPGLVVRIRDVDFADYLNVPGNRLSLAAFHGSTHARWIGLPDHSGTEQHGSSAQGPHLTP